MDALEERQPTKEEIEHATKLHARISFFDKEQKERRAAWEKARTYVNGNPGSDGKSGLVRVNLIGSFCETLQANIYAKAPEIGCTPEDRPDEQEYPALAASAKTMQAALNSYLVKDAKLKQRGKAAVRSVLTCGTSWVKLLYQKDKASEPLLKNNLNDIQDNIANIEKLRSETEDEAECSGYDAKLLELRQQEQALNANAEPRLAEGLVMDSVPTGDVIILDNSIKDIDEVGQASALAHRIKMTAGAFKSVFKIKPPGSAAMETSDSAVTSKEADEDDKIVIVYEVWSKADNTVYTICKGTNKYIRDPYQPEQLGDRWYPFFALQIRRIDGVLYPLSTVELLIELQDEYNTRHTRASDHRRKNTSLRIFNKSSNITDEEINAINNRGSGDDAIGVTADPNQPLQNSMVNFPEIPFNPQMYDVSEVMRDMEMVAGVQDAARGAINRAKTATEAEIMAQGMQSRSSEVIDTVEDWLTEIAQYAAHLLILNLTPEQVKERLGQSAIWPEITGREMLGKMGITIRGGSTARPNKMRERDQWIQLMPMMQEALEKSAALKSAGDDKMAKAVLKVLQETLNRFDEKLDIKEFLGIELGEDQEQEFEMPPELQQKIQQGEQLIQDLQGKLQMAGEALKSKVDDMQLQRDKSAEAANTALESARIKADADLQAKREATEASAATERERIASNERIALAREFQKAGMAELSEGVVRSDLDESDEQIAPITPATIAQAIITQAETAAMAQIQSTQALAQMIEQSSEKSTQAVAELATLITQAMTAPKTATLSNGKTITVRTGQ